MTRANIPKFDPKHPKICAFLVPAFIGLNLLRSSAELCEILQLPTNAVCGSADYMKMVDNHALCALYCCCRAQATKKEDCVRDVLWEADDAIDRHSYYKAEMPYDSIKTKDLISNPKTGLERRSRPSGSRIPDVVIVQDRFKLGTVSNIERAIEIKFPPDDFINAIGPDGFTQLQAYKILFGRKPDITSISEQNCDCDNKEKRRQHNLVLEHGRQYYEDQSPMNLMNNLPVAVQRGTLAMIKRVYKALEDLLEHSDLIFGR